MSHDSQDKMLADALATFSGSDDKREAVAPKAATTTRRTRIVETVASDAAGTYRMMVAGVTLEVSASDIGEAVYLIERSKAVPNLSGYVFLWTYTMIQPDGSTVRGSHPDVREAVQAARIRNS